jgi:Domain of unknown function (DUF4331)
VSDHFSGPRSMAQPHGDITDVYAFPSPERAGNLVIAMNVHPKAPADTAFSDAMDFQLRVRPVSIGAEIPQSGCFVVGDDEFTFRFHFSPPTNGPTGDRPLQVGTCVMPNGDQANVTVDSEEAEGPGPRVFAGLRSDPFIFDLGAWQKMVSNRRIDFPEVGENTVDGWNVLSVVVDVPCEAFFRSDSLFAVVGETLVAGRLPVRLERVGRPEIKNITMGMQEYDTVNRELDIRDLYNSEDAFHLGHGYLGAYRARLNANLAFWDSLDDDIAWPLDEGGVHPLTELLLQDFLVVDASKPYSERSYFDIEMAALSGRTHGSCGGRSLNDNFIDTMYTVLINGGLGPRIHQGVGHALAKGTKTFPYLASSLVP